MTWWRTGYRAPNARRFDANSAGRAMHAQRIANQAVQVTRASAASAWVQDEQWAAGQLAMRFDFCCK